MRVPEEVSLFLSEEPQRKLVGLVSPLSSCIEGSSTFFSSIQQNSVRGSSECQISKAILSNCREPYSQSLTPLACRHQIFAAGQLASIPKPRLESLFGGPPAQRLFELAHGIDTDEVCLCLNSHLVREWANPHT